jgi:hypothetical protein
MGEVGDTLWEVKGIDVLGFSRLSPLFLLITVK